MQQTIPSQLISKPERQAGRLEEAILQSEERSTTIHTATKRLVLIVDRMNGLSPVGVSTTTGDESEPNGLIARLERINSESESALNQLQSAIDALEQAV